MKRIQLPVSILSVIVLGTAAVAAVHQTAYGTVGTDPDVGDAPAPYCAASNSAGFDIFGGLYLQATFLGRDSHVDDGVVLVDGQGLPLAAIEPGSAFSVVLDLSYYGDFADFADAYVKVWIDWNADGDWDDPDELLSAMSASFGNIQTQATWYGSFVNDHNDGILFGGRFQHPGDSVTLGFVAPAAAAGGTSWMRVLMYYPYGDLHPGPCADDAVSHEGEIEDYPVVLGTPDSDGDGAPDDIDICPGTSLPEAVVPSAWLGVNRHADIDGDGVMETRYPAPPKPSVDGPYTVEMTLGCSCEQILAVCEYGQGHVKHGCTGSAIEAWANQSGGATSADPRYDQRCNE